MSAPPTEWYRSFRSTPDRQQPVVARLHVRLIREAALLGALYAVYAVARLIASRHAGEAFDHAEAVWRLERAMLLPNEATLQSHVLQWPALTRAANGYYAYVHFPSAVLTLAWLFLFRPQHYVWVRRVLVTLTAAALVGHLLYPLAPPRMLPDHGMVDTGIKFGQSVYGAPGEGLANQFAAMPSLHVGWALLIALALIATTRRRWHWLWMLHATTTVLVVVVTGNHYWLDGMVATSLLGCALALQLRHVPPPAAEPEREPAEVTVAGPEAVEELVPDPTPPGDYRMGPDPVT